MNVMTETNEHKRDRLLLAWKTSKEALEIAKEAEMNLRKACAEFLFPNAQEGTNRVELGNGYSAKMVAKFNYKLDSDLDKIDATVAIMGQMGNEGAFIAERLIKWSASLSVSEYRTLTERAEKCVAGDTTYATEARILRELQNILTVTPGSPTLEIEEPKQGRKR